MKDMIDPDPNLRPEPLVDDVDRALRPQNLNDFTGQANVINGVSELLRDVFGDDGMGARAALGANALPLNASVEVESVFEIKV